jgi:hypothetical protein
MSIFKHVSRLEVAQIYPDQLLANTGDLAHLFHDLGYQVSPLIFSSASPYIGLGSRCDLPQDARRGNDRRTYFRR